MEADVFLEQLREEIQSHPATHHPFLQRFARGPLRLGQIRAFGLQHYQLVKVFVNYMTNLLPRIPDAEAQRFFRVIFDDEFGRESIFHSHPALYRRFLSGLGLLEEDWGKVRLLPEVAAFIEGHLLLTREMDFLVGLGAIGPAHEFSIPLMFNYLLAGLRAHTSLSEPQLEYFTLHVAQDVQHARIFETLIARQAGEAEGQQRTREGALLSLRLRRRFWDALEHSVFGE
ncbi:MAG: iron-containing redox enzyme family protein [Acidobacteria bacterium]|nr:iron-containing redox enzyme family protein [Acidobacteriota bacterium]